MISSLEDTICYLHFIPADDICLPSSADILSKLANALAVSSDYLMNGTTDELANSSLTDKELLNQFKMIEKMPEDKKSVVKIFLDAFITKDKIKQLAL